MNRNLLVTMTVVAMTILTHGQGQQGGRGGAPAGARAGGPALPPLMQTAPKPAIPNVKAPDTLPATRRDQSGVVTRSRPLCAYPLVAKYKGSGSTDEASNFVCSTGF
jgi:Tannase and feruloyl esterase